MSITQHLDEIENQADEIEMKAHKSNNIALVNLSHAIRKLVYVAQSSVVDKESNAEGGSQSEQ